jgi:2-octaprenyl-6-methoxyphenol hydroxylase
VSVDPRTLALSQGSVQFLQRLGAWPAAAAEPIVQERVSQMPPTLSTAFGQPEVRLHAADLGVPQLGAVLSYGALVATLQRAWQQAVDAQPARLRFRLGTPVSALTPVPDGGVLVDQARRAVVSDYGHTVWVGTVMLKGATPGRAFERFTRHGPAALLPLQRDADGRARAALVWCVPTADDPVRALSDAQRLAVLRSIFPAEAGQLVGLSPLKDFALGLNAERTLVHQRTARISNAAQTLHPVTGQGLTLGLRDAHEPVAVLRWADDIEAALRRAEWGRAAQRRSMIAATDLLARSFTWQLPGAATARGLGLAALQALPPLKDWLARRMMFGSR